MSHKLGRRPPDYTRPRLWLEDYTASTATALPVLPVFKGVVDYASGVSFPMYMNDTLGDCTCAGACHSIGAWTKYAQGTEAVFDNSVPLAGYEAAGGYVPGNPNTDRGCQMADVLAYWHSPGFDGHTVQAYAQLKSTNAVALNQALQLFGSVYLGVNLPQSAESQFGNQPWSYVKGSPILGGHCIVLQGMDNTVAKGGGIYNIVSWGATQRATLEWMRTYLEEAWVAVSPDWLTAQGGTLTGVDVATLTADMALL